MSKSGIEIEFRELEAVRDGAAVNASYETVVYDRSKGAQPMPLVVGSGDLFETGACFRMLTGLFRWLRGGRVTIVQRNLGGRGWVRRAVCEMGDVRVEENRAV